MSLGAGVLDVVNATLLSIPTECCGNRVDGTSPICRPGAVRLFATAYDGQPSAWPNEAVVFGLQASHVPMNAGTLRRFAHQLLNYPSPPQTRGLSMRAASLRHRKADTSTLSKPAPFSPVFQSPERCVHFPRAKYSNGGARFSLRYRLGLNSSISARPSVCPLLSSFTPLANLGYVERCHLPPDVSRSVTLTMSGQSVYNQGASWSPTTNTVAFYLRRKL